MAQRYGLQSSGNHKRFLLNRTEDVSGISGTGVVAQGVQFSDGKCVTRWVESRVGAVQTCVWDSMEDVEAVHGHGGSTEVVWLD